MAQEMDEERKTSLEKMVATELLKLAMETDEERKARLKKMVATTQLRLQSFENGQALILVVFRSFSRLILSLSFLCSSVYEALFALSFSFQSAFPSMLKLL